jgi:oligosaccharide 4-alpha-D-glucosyltransferase
MYDDDGTSTRTLEKQDFELLTFTASTQGKNITIDIKTGSEATYKRKVIRKFTILVPGEAFTSITVNGKPAIAAPGLKPISLAHGKFASALVEFTGKPVRVELTR